MSIWCILMKYEWPFLLPTAQEQRDPCTEPHLSDCVWGVFSPSDCGFCQRARECHKYGASSWQTPRQAAGDLQGSGSSLTSWRHCSNSFVYLEGERCEAPNWCQGTAVMLTVITLSPADSITNTLTKAVTLRHT